MVWLLEAVRRPVVAIVVQHRLPFVEDLVVVDLGLYVYVVSAGYCSIHDVHRRWLWQRLDEFQLLAVRILIAVLELEGLHSAFESALEARLVFFEHPLVPLSYQPDPGHERGREFNLRCHLW